jgi:lipoprotein-anchoring transpeptidase ErfK/SrfK
MNTLSRKISKRLITAALVAATSFVITSVVSAQPITAGKAAMQTERAMPRLDAAIDPGDIREIAPQKRRTVINYATGEAPGTIVIDTSSTYLYFVLGGGKAVRYGIGVGRDGFRWSGIKSVERKAEWPDWTPPAEMLARQPYLPRFMAGGPGNPLGARAMYLSGSMYRIHGTNAPSTIGGRVSSGCIRMLNEDVIDLYQRVTLGTKVVVPPDHPAPRIVTPASLTKPRSASAGSRSATY